LIENGEDLQKATNLIGHSNGTQVNSPGVNMNPGTLHESGIFTSLPWIMDQFNGATTCPNNMLKYEKK
jgi:hypothetical protein